MMLPAEGGTGVMTGGGEAGMSGGAVPPLCQDEPAPVEQTNFRLEAACRQGTEMLKVRHIRDPRCPEYMEGPTSAPGLPVYLSSLVVTGVFGDKMSVQDQEGGSYSGLWVYSSGRVDLSEITLS